jgi:hypothetical protein
MHVEPWFLVMDRETFAKMWEMSASGSEAEHCFMRIRQTEYYAEAREGENVLRGMPEVSDYGPWDSHYVPYILLVTVSRRAAERASAKDSRRR